MNITLKTALISICAIFLISFLKNIKNEYSYIVALAGGLLIMLIIIPTFRDIVSHISEMFPFSSTMSESIRVFIKSVLICQICSLTKSFCKDSSNSFLASCVDISEKTAIFIVSMPLIESVIKIILNYIGT